jgi:CheY-like chemotaxis protein
MEALSKATKENFDIIIMDLNMPVMGGIEATSKIINFCSMQQTTQELLCPD